MRPPFCGAERFLMRFFVKKGGRSPPFFEVSLILAMLFNLKSAPCLPFRLFMAPEIPRYERPV